MNDQASLSRRRFLQTGFLASFGLLSAGSRHLKADDTSFVEANPFPYLFYEALRYPFSLPPLPHGTEAFEPEIDALTMEIHHGRHHAAYVRNLNRALSGYPQLHSLDLGNLLADLESLPEDIRQTVRDNGGGHANHVLYWETMKPGGSMPSGTLAALIDEEFGSMEALGDALVEAGARRFGSGWAWLSVLPNGQLTVESTPNQDNPGMHGNVPLLGIDVWEHAYYLNYKYRRGDYMRAFLGLIDWEAVSRRHAMLKS